MAPDKPPRWRCPHCEQRFTSRDQWHSCGSFELDALFAHSEPQVRALFTELLEIVQACGPVTEAYRVGKQQHLVG